MCECICVRVSACECIVRAVTSGCVLNIHIICIYMCTCIHIPICIAVYISVYMYVEKTSI